MRLRPLLLTRPRLLPRSKPGTFGRNGRAALGRPFCFARRSHDGGGARSRAGLDRRGRPRSLRFDDIYFSAADGLAESRAVFLQGCGLPNAWRDHPNFTVAELGFGTGLNILALLDLWRRARGPGQRLSIFSVEAFPLDAADAARALAAWPELADLAARLLEQWPRRAPGFHRLTFPELDATLDVAIGEAGWALEQWSGAAHAWFLDGFSPAKNPLMWRAEVLTAVAARSAPGARLGTFTVAGDVRRGLQATGFDVAKASGHGRKRERLEGRLPGGILGPTRSAAGRGDRRGKSPVRPWRAPCRPWAPGRWCWTRRVRARAPRAIRRPWSRRRWTRAAARGRRSTPRPWRGPAISTRRSGLRRSPVSAACSWRTPNATPNGSTPWSPAACSIRDGWRGCRPPRPPSGPAKP